MLDEPLGPGSPEQLVAEGAVAKENAFSRFDAWCRGDASCALHGGDPAAAYRTLIARAGTQPVPAAGVDHPLTAYELGTLASYFLGQAQARWDPSQPTDGWQMFAAAIAQALNGRADLFGMLYQYAYSPAYYAGRKAITCVGSPPQRPDYARLRAQIALVRPLAPTTGGVSELWELQTGCLGWPAPPRPQPAADWHLGNAPVLVVAARNDPMVPAAVSTRVARSFTRAALLVSDADGHIAFSHSDCVAKAEQRYLVSRVAPPPAARCP